MASYGERFGWDLVGIADTPGNAMDPWVALTLAATRTERVRLAACVTNFQTRHPADHGGSGRVGRRRVRRPSDPRGGDRP